MIVLLAALAAAAAQPPSAEVPRAERLTRILELEDRRTVGDGDLDRLLADPDPGVRRRAALAAGRIGDVSMMTPLVERMNDAEPEVRQMSAFALGLIGDRGALERLRASLADPEPVVRARAAEAIGRLGDPRAAADLVRLVAKAAPKGTPPTSIRGDDPGSAADPWLELRLAIFALVRLKDPGAAAAALLVDGKPRFDWWAATWAAMRLEQPELRPILVAAASSTDPLSRLFAARGLGALKDPAGFDLLAGLAREKNEPVAVNALRALATLGDPRAVPIAAAALRSTSLTMVLEALRALSALPPDPSLRPRVMELVGHREPSVRAAALRALARIDHEDFGLVLSGLDPDQSLAVRAEIAAALAEAGDPTSLSILQGMLKESDPRVLPAVLEALRKAQGADVLPILREHLAHPDFAVRAAAAEGLAALKATGESAALAAAYRRSLPDTDVDARLALVAALALQKDERARATLKSAAAEDPARVVRERASAALRAMGEEVPPPGPEPIDRPHLDYRLALAPYEPVGGTAVFTPRVFIHTRYGKIEIHLNVVEAPLYSAYFQELARRGFYDGLTFHRVVPNFVIQGGDPRADGNGGPGYTLRDEVGEKPYGRGAVGIALSGKDTGGSQFFITHVPTPHLDGGYTIIGQVVSGMDVVDKIRIGDVIEKVEVWTGR
ncbi:MAG TPA: HEAT repeat domain-containing protein [Vicinamibacteria bacterium]